MLCTNEPNLYGIDYPLRKYPSDFCKFILRFNYIALCSFKPVTITCFGMFC
jgi:hypothetical protein